MSNWFPATSSQMEGPPCTTFAQVSLSLDPDILWKLPDDEEEDDDEDIDKELKEPSPLDKHDIVELSGEPNLLLNS